HIREEDQVYNTNQIIIYKFTINLLTNLDIHTSVQTWKFQMESELTSEMASPVLLKNLSTVRLSSVSWAETKLVIVRAGIPSARDIVVVEPANTQHWPNLMGSPLERRYCSKIGALPVHCQGALPSW